MLRYNNVYLLIFCFILNGCAPTGTFKKADPETGELKTVAEITLDRTGMFEIEEKDGIKMRLDTREKNFWEKNVVPIFSSILDKAQGGITVDQ